MLHTKIIDASKNEKIEISKAENFLNQSKFGAVIYFVGTVRDQHDNKKNEKPRIIENNIIDFNILFNVLFQKKKYL